MKYYFSAIIAVFLLFLSCHKKPNKAPEAPVYTNPVVNQPTVSDKEDEDVDIPGQNNLFAFDLYSQIKSKSGNIVFSPFSISSALAMTYNGARGETEAEMARTMHFSIFKERFDATFKNLLENMQSDSSKSGFQLRISNGLFIQKNFGVLDAFYLSMRDNYHAGFDYLDFKNQTEKARLFINKWAADKTNNKINELLAPGVLNTETRMVIANAIYFLADWQTPFDPKYTEPADFYTSASSAVKVDFMYLRKINFPYTENMEYQALIIPYRGGKYSMLIVLPRNKEGILKLEATFKPENFIETVNSTQYKLVNLAIPKFTYTSGFNLKLELSQLGMMKSFSNLADFSGITGQRDLKIDDVIHKAFIAVNEKGTEAAAVTAVIMAVTSAAPRHEEVIDFTANHPFLYFIFDNQMKTILFMGRMSNPMLK